MSKMDEKVKRILEIADKKKDESVKFLQKLISTDTTVIEEGKFGNEGNAQGWIAEEFKDMGCDVEVFEPDNEILQKKYSADFTPGHNYEGRPIVAGKIKGQGGGRSLLIDMHIDTVPEGNRDLWKHDPFGGEIEDGKMYGRGAVDMKAGHAGTVMAVRYIQEAGIKLKGDLTLMSVVDEERGEGNGCLAYLDRGYRADGAFFPEGTNLTDIVFGSQGLLFCKLRIRGKSVHTTIKWTGVNAIEKMTKVINGLDGLEKKWGLTTRQPELGPPLISVNRIHGGTEVNSLAEECEAYASIIYLPIMMDKDGRGSQVKKEVEECISYVCKGDPWLSEHPVEIEWINEITPSVIDKDHDLIKNLKEIAEKYKPGEIKVTWGELPTMSRIMNDQADMPMILFGPGGLDQAHAIDEWVYVSEYLDYIKIAVEFILSWCGVAED